MYLDDNFLRFVLLSETGTREPLYILLRILHKYSKEQIKIFLNTLISLVQEELLQCDYWSKDELRYHELKKGFSKKLRAYIKESLQRKQSLTGEPEGMPLFEFIVTEKGKLWLKQRYDNVEVCGIKYIEKIKEYEITEKKYPAFLRELCPKYIAEIEEPSNVYGSWWYLVDKSRDYFIFGYFIYSGLLFVYDSEKKEWVNFN